MGAKAELNLLRMGFYPAGGGEIEARIWPAADQLEPFDLIARGARRQLCRMPCAGCRAVRASWNIWARRWAGPGISCAWPPRARTGQRAAGDLGHEQVCEVFTRFGVKGLTAETVAQELARDVRAYLDSDAALGPYLADQWALPLALAVWRRGQPAQYTCTELTAHARSNFGVIGQFLPVRFSARRWGRLAGEGRTRLGRIRARGATRP